MSEGVDTNAAPSPSQPPIKALQTALLHTPRELDDRPGQRFAYLTWGRGIISLAIAYHAVVLLVHNLPSKGLASGVHRFFNDKLAASVYMRATGNSQSWAMFAPNPHRVNQFMKVLVRDSHDETWDMKVDMYGRRQYPYIFYSREGKINRRVLEEKGYRRDYAAWVCRSWEMSHGGEPAKEVVFVKMWSRVPAPEKVYATMGYDPMTLHLDQREEETIVCTSTYQAQLSPELRSRFGLPPSDSFRDITQRTWWDAKQAQARLNATLPRTPAPSSDEPDSDEQDERIGEVEGAN